MEDEGILCGFIKCPICSSTVMCGVEDPHPETHNKDCKAKYDAVYTTDETEAKK